ncbi:alpha/beta hydrolase [Gordonia sp. PKS22-38]|uniref:Alpha/beta hydrolase n=1 Tax=Gordonia prachuapensis TaxID=3115651 RepID=A0ABU7MYZ2_9ACTN|nr:alpha/beta hydrolase [Gordonia sp. PKS22-38]
MSVRTTDQQWRPDGPGSVRARAVNTYLARVAHPLMVASMGRSGPSPRRIAAMRPGLNRSLVALAPTPGGTRIDPVRDRRTGGDGVPAGQVRGEWVSAHGGPPRPATPDDTRIIYYLHGSGYVVCSARTHRGLVARLSRRTGWSAFSLDYRLAPEHRFPTAGDDAIRGYHWLLDQGYQPDQIVVAGDSAGGHLALDLIADNHRRGVGQPRGLVMFSPLYDPTFDLAVANQARGARDPIIDAVAAQRILQLYTGTTEPDHPRMRIALDDTMALPPTLIQVGGLEVMGDDARAIARVMRTAGGDVRLQEWPGQGHVFQMFGRLIPESRLALREATRFMSTC